MDTVAYKVDDAVWDWLKSLLCDPEALRVGLQKMKENQANEVDPKREQLILVSGLMEDEERKIKRLVNEMGKYDDGLVINTFRKEIAQATKNYNSLRIERVSLTNALIQIELTDVQQDLILGFAEKIRSKLVVASFEQKRQIMDVLKVKVVIHYGDAGKWLAVSCAIPAYDDAIVFNPS